MWKKCALCIYGDASVDKPRERTNSLVSCVTAHRASPHLCSCLFPATSHKGSSGGDVEAWISSLTSRKLTFPHIKIVYPTAPSQPYTPLGGMPSNVWFDRSAVAISAPEKKSSIDSMCESVSDLIEKEVAIGIPLQRIVIGGFSMGGALSLHLAYRYKKLLAGCFVMSSFLNDNSLVYEALKIECGQNAPPLLQFHGKSDELVPFKWGVTTHRTLKSLGVKGKLITLENVDHELVSDEVKQLKEWLQNIVPEIN